MELLQTDEKAGGGLMGETETPQKGPVEGTSRILRELLRTPSFKKSINVVLSDLDPENARLLAQVLVWEDVEFFLSLVNSLPVLLNVLVELLVELVRQLDNFPDELISGFVAGIIDGLDADGLGKGLGLAVMLLLKMGATENVELKEAGPELVKRFSRGLAGALEAETAEGQSAGALLVEKLVPTLSSMASHMGESAAQKDSKTNALVESISDGIQKVSSDNPQFMDSVVSPLLESWRKATGAPVKPARAPGKKAKAPAKPAKAPGKAAKAATKAGKAKGRSN
jgi:hypothetical protein